MATWNQSREWEEIWIIAASSSLHHPISTELLITDCENSSDKDFPQRSLSIFFMPEEKLSKFLECSQVNIFTNQLGILVQNSIRLILLSPDR